ncbi:MAG: GMC family oxidoreductase [Gammaproteobacteria bacterium]|nr:GMC family oxidoreductase [Gammaproteobacteria bacterium]
MIRDLNELADDAFAGAGYDVCVVGAGFVGIALAMALPKTTRVLLLEAGGRTFRPEAQDPYRGENTGHEYFPLDACRLRQFGGTSHLWAGWSRAMDAHDFIARDDVPHSGWPIGKPDLDPYFERTRQVLGVAPGINWQWGGALDHLDGLESFDFHWSYPLVVMSERYGDYLEASGNIDCVLNANLTDLRLNEQGAQVIGIEIGDYRQRRFAVRAERVVLATGGIETARLLLNFDGQVAGGIGNGHDLVGRFFMEHPHYDVGHFILDDAVNRRLVQLRRKDAPLITEFIKPTAAFMRAAGCLNFGLRVIHWGQERELGFRERLGRLLSRDGPLEEAEEWLRQTPAACRMGGLQRVIDEQTPDHQRAPLTAPCDVDGLIRIASEQAPNPASRITLNGERDAFGLRRVTLDWRLQALDKYTMKAAVLKLGEQFARRDIGRVRLVDWLVDDAAPIPGLDGEEVGGNHHIGTTRMADDPRRGVVDADLKVFGIDNLYLCGSGVFPTAGQANPTFAAVQLALRLADHLAA